MNPLLFVYGTLMSTAASTLGRDMRLRLRREARVVGPASIQGQLFDRGRFPVLIFNSGALDRVHGELIEISNPAATFPWLDAYEGIGRNAAGTDEYERLERSVDQAASGTTTAWVYVYNKPVTGLPRIASGRWKG
jgi:gamma-glutamylcyclotransferase (GGCT)/AIG2-like uncharacterized protein YtfP